QVDPRDGGHVLEGGEEGRRLRIVGEDLLLLAGLLLAARALVGVLLVLLLRLLRVGELLLQVQLVFLGRGELVVDLAVADHEVEQADEDDEEEPHARLGDRREPVERRAGRGGGRLRGHQYLTLSCRAKVAMSSLASFWSSFFPWRTWTS